MEIRRYSAPVLAKPPPPGVIIACTVALRAPYTRTYREAHLVTFSILMYDDVRFSERYPYKVLRTCLPFPCALPVATGDMALFIGHSGKDHTRYYVLACSGQLASTYLEIFHLFQLSAESCLSWLLRWTSPYTVDAGRCGNNWVTEYRTSIQGSQLQDEMRLSKVFVRAEKKKRKKRGEEGCVHDAVFRRISCSLALYSYMYVPSTVTISAK